MIQFIIIFCIFVLVLLPIFGVAIVITKNKQRDNDGGDATNANTPPNNITTMGDSKDFFPVKDFCDYAIDLGNQEYRAILEVGSVNYGLMSPQEQAVTDACYQGMLNSLKFTIETYKQTAEFDSMQMQEVLHKNVQEAVDLFPSVANYGIQYEDNMKYLTDYLGNSKVKKDYVIIPYGSADFANNLSAMSAAEVQDFALEELMTRASVVANGLVGCNLPVKLLNKCEIAEVLYSYYHRGYSHVAQDVLRGAFSSVVVTGNPYNDKVQLDSILADAENKIRTNLSGSGSPEEEKLYRYIIEILGDLRSESKPMNLKELLDLSKEKALEERYKTYGTRYVGEPTSADYLKASQLSGSGVSLDDLSDVYSKENPSEEKETNDNDEIMENLEENQSDDIPEDFWMKDINFSDDEEDM